MQRMDQQIIIAETAKAAQLLRESLSLSASDVHITPGYPPMVRVAGIMQALRGYPLIEPADAIELFREISNDEHRQRLQSELALDFTWGFGKHRFRANAAFTRTGLQLCFRIIPMTIPTPDELMLPTPIIELADLPRGLVLVTGTAGAGKSTTLACLLNLINQRRQATIMTIEDPIEFIFPPRRSLVTQREIGTHSPSFDRALKDVLRQDPDVVMIGEMRDLETISAAITVAETGHLVYATLHSYDAPSAVDRIIDVFPSRQQQQIRTQLAGTLKAIISQVLIPAKGGGRVAAREILIVTPAIANLVRQGRSHEIASAIEMGHAQGMVSMERSIQELVRTGVIEQAYLSKYNR